MSLLKRGSKGPEVKTLQRLLNAVNNAGLEVDGDFGTATRNAVITYQASRGLGADGEVGTRTWDKLLRGEG